LTRGRAKGGKIDSAKSGALRPTGIRVIGDMPWGTHICVFYETSQDLLDTAAQYFHAGLKNNELCLWAVSEPVTKTAALKALQNRIPDFEKHRRRGQIELLDGHEWYLAGEEFDLQRITGGWNAKLRDALERGFEGLRISGNAFWIATHHWQEFCAYEHELDRTLVDKKMIVMCTYSLRAARAVDILDVVRAHQRSVARRRGDWEFLATPELTDANLEIARLTDALGILSKPFPGREKLTPRELVALAQIVRGASNKEAARTLGISSRTMEFHRAHILKKLDARNPVDLVFKVLAGAERR